MKPGDIIEFPPLPDIKKCGIRKPIPYFQQTSDEERVQSLIGKTFVVKDRIDGTAILEIKG